MYLYRADNFAIVQLSISFFADVVLVMLLNHCHNQVLSDDKKRALYDQYGEAGVKSTVGGPSNAYTVLERS